MEGFPRCNTVGVRVHETSGEDQVNENNCSTAAFLSCFYCFICIGSGLWDDADEKATGMNTFKSFITSFDFRKFRNGFVSIENVRDIQLPKTLMEQYEGVNIS